MPWGAWSCAASGVFDHAHGALLPVLQRLPVRRGLAPGFLAVNTNRPDILL